MGHTLKMIEMEYPTGQLLRNWAGIVALIIAGLAMGCSDGTGDDNPDTNDTDSDQETDTAAEDGRFAAADLMEITKQSVDGIWQATRYQSVACDANSDEWEESHSMVLIEVNADETSLTGKDCDSVDECNDYYNAAWDYGGSGMDWFSRTRFSNGKDDEGACKAFKRWRELYLLKDGTLVTVTHEYAADASEDPEESNSCDGIPLGDYECEYISVKEWQRIN